MIVRITSRYGEVSQLHPTGHKGVDIALNEGTPLRSVSDGIVERVVDLGSENIGKGVIIRYDDNTQTIYGHMSDIKVKVGELVQDGQIIGYSGNTGHSTGPHLHFGLKESGQFVDPTPFVEQTVNTSVWDSLSHTQSVGGFIYEKFIGGGIEHFVSHYIMALPVLVGVSIGVWGLLNMVSSKLATWGVGFVMALGALMIL